MFPTPWDRLEQYASTHGEHFHVLRIFRQRNGVPNIEVGTFMGGRGTGNFLVSHHNGTMMALVPGASGSGRELDWDTGSRGDGQIYASVDGGPQRLFAEGSSGSAPAPWVTSGHLYIFSLYEGSTHKRLLNTVSILP